MLFFAEFIQWGFSKNCTFQLLILQVCLEYHFTILRSFSSFLMCYTNFLGAVTQELLKTSMKHIQMVICINWWRYILVAYCPTCVTFMRCYARYDVRDSYVMTLWYRIISNLICKILFMKSIPHSIVILISSRATCLCFGLSQ